MGRQQIFPGYDVLRSKPESTHKHPKGERVYKALEEGDISNQLCPFDYPFIAIF